MPQVGEQDRFEQIYTNRLKSLWRRVANCSPMRRAALDLGFHLYEPEGGEGNPVMGGAGLVSAQGHPRLNAWARGARGLRGVPIPGLLVDHIQYWAAHPEPVYLEAVDGFIAQDVRDLVEQNGGFAWLREAAQSQRTATLRMSLSAGLEEALDQMPRHRSLRLDGPDFRGRPLGHRLDPLRCELDRMAPEHFEKLVSRLLEVP